MDSTARAYITCFGEALIDFLARSAAADGEPQHFVRQAGGSPANTAVAVARLGGASAFVGMLASDLFGDFLFESMRDAGVHTGFIVRTAAAPTGLAFIALDADGERRFSFYRPPAADLLFRPDHFADACFASTAIFHAGSNSLTDAETAAATLAGLDRARAAGAIVSVDVNLRLALWPDPAHLRPRVWEELRRADIVKLCADEVAWLADGSGAETAVLEELERAGVRLILMTDGPGPIRYFTAGRHGTVPAFRVRAIDTTAAGDAFVAGVLDSLVRAGIDRAGLDGFLIEDRALRTAVRFGAACGALAVTRHGAFAAMPPRAEVERLLEEQP